MIKINYKLRTNAKSQAMNEANLTLVSKSYFLFYESPFQMTLKQWILVADLKETS